MRYCILYNNKSNIINEIDEIIIRYDKNKILTLFTDFIPKHQEQRIIVDLYESNDEEDIESIKKILSIHKENPQLKFDLRIHKFKEEIVKILKNSDINYFFNHFANNWDTFLGLINEGVSDIYIVEDMCFELDKVSEIAHMKNIKIRTFPNIAQSSWNKTADIYKFFIRPEDIEFYDKYIDVCEFYGENNKNDIYYDIYKNKKKWFGNLKEIITNLNEDLDSRYIIPRFTEQRLKCGKKCLKGSKCQVCNQVLDLSENLKKANLIVKIDKK